MAYASSIESRFKTRRRKRRLFSVFIAVLIVILIIAILAGLSWLPFLRIGSIEITGAKTLDSTSLQDVARGTIANAYLHLFAKDNILLYPKSNIASAILAAYPALDSVQVHAKNFRSLSINVVERKPVALWCGNTPSSSLSCDVIDASGLVYSSTRGVDDNTFNFYYGKIASDELPQQFLTPEQFPALAALVATILEHSTTSAKSIFVDESEDVHMKFENGFTLLFALNDDTAGVYQRFLLAQKSEPFKNHVLNDFEYLDLRFGDKLYYKLKTQ